MMGFCAVASVAGKAGADGYTRHCAAGSGEGRFGKGRDSEEIVGAQRVPVRNFDVGVCNHTVALLDEAWAVTKEPLVNNQIEVHPFLDQNTVIDATRRHGMSVTAYCPIARGRVPGNEVLERIGRTHGKTASQVSL